MRRHILFRECRRGTGPAARTLRWRHAWLLGLLAACAAEPRDPSVCSRGPHGAAIQRPSNPLHGPSAGKPDEEHNGTSLQGATREEEHNGTSLQGATRDEEHNGSCLQGLQPDEEFNGTSLQGLRPDEEVNGIRLQGGRPEEELQGTRLQGGRPEDELQGTRLQGARRGR